jgi:hypothetical protein
LPALLLLLPCAGPVCSCPQPLLLLLLLLLLLAVV